MGYQVAQVANDNAADPSELSVLQSLDPVKSTDGTWMIFKVCVWVGGCVRERGGSVCVGVCVGGAYVVLCLVFVGVFSPVH